MASAGYGLDHITAIDILKTRRFGNGFTVAIFLKPFSFEGQRRQDEVWYLATVDVRCFFTVKKIKIFVNDNPLEDVLCSCIYSYMRIKIWSENLEATQQPLSLTVKIPCSLF